MKTNTYAHLARMMMIALVSVFSFASCDIFIEDDWGMDHDQSKALSGQWYGDFGMYYNYQYGDRVYTFDSYDTDVVFYPEYNGAHYGWGKQVDWYAKGPYEYLYHKFEWQIRDGILYLSYPYDHNLDCWIRDYRMTNDYFSGYFGNSSDSFCLRKIRDYYNWAPYVDTYSYGERRDWYSGGYHYAKGKDAKTSLPADSTQTGTIVGYGNRFSKGN